MDISKKVDVILGGIHKVRSSLRGGGRGGGKGGLQKANQNEQGGGGSNLFVRSLYEKITAK